MEVVKKKKNRKSLLLRLSVTAFVLYVVVSLVNVQIRISEKRQELENLQDQIVIQEISNGQLKSALNTDDSKYMEELARDELDYAKPGERIFINIAGK